MKKILIIGGIGILGLALMAGDSVYRKYKEFFDKMTYFLGTISGFDVSWTRIKFNIQPIIKNNTPHHISISTLGIARLEKIEVRDRIDKTVASVYLDLDSFEIKEFEALSFPKIPIEIPLTQALLNVLQIDFTGNFEMQKILNQFRFILHVNVAGKKLEYQLTF